MNITMLVKWCAGNPGAASVLGALWLPENKLAHDIIVPKLEELTSIRGSNLYVLFSDICDRDLSKVCEVVTVVPAEILENACSKQDRSGKITIDKYLEELKDAT